MTRTSFQKKKLFNIRADFLICLCLVIWILAVYWQVRNHGFVNYDDTLYVSNNPHVRTGFTAKGIIWALTTGYASNWHPLTWLSHMLDCQIYGLNPGQHHMTNVLFHILNTLLLFFVFKRMTGELWQSSFVAALFALHPLHVESVAWIAERKDVLSTFFFLLTLWSYIHWVDHSSKSGYLLAFLFFILGLMAKPMLVTLPFVLFLLDYWPLNRFQVKESERGSKSNQTGLFLVLIFEKMPFFFLSAVSSVVTYLVQKSSGAVSPLDVIPFKLRIANILVSYISYIKKTIMPYNLASLYPYPESISIWKVAGAGLLIVVVSVVVFRIRRTKPYLAVGWFWYLGSLVPVIGLVQVGFQAMADRYTYVPLTGLFIVIGWGMPDIIAEWRYKRRVLAISSVFILSIFTMCTGFQIRYWKNSVTLFEHAKNVTQNNYVIYHKLGDAFFSKGDLYAAIKYYSEAIRIKPEFIPARINIAVALREEGKFDKALEHLFRALSLNSNLAVIYYEMGLTLKEMGRFEEAIKHFREVLRIDPYNAKAYNNLGVVFAGQGKDTEAISNFHEAIRIDNRYASAYYNLGRVFLNQGRIQTAIINYRKALDFDTDMTPALYNLSWILATHEDKKYRNGEEAVRLGERLCKITRYNHPLALDVLSAAYAETGRFDEAVLTAKKAQKLALDQGMKKLSLGLEDRLRSYQAGHTYRQKLFKESDHQYD